MPRSWLWHLRAPASAPPYRERVLVYGAYCLQTRARVALILHHAAVLLLGQPLFDCVMKDMQVRRHQRVCVLETYYRGYFAGIGWCRSCSCYVHEQLVKRHLTLYDTMSCTARMPWQAVVCAHGDLPP